MDQGVKAGLVLKGWALHHGTPPLTLTLSWNDPSLSIFVLCTTFFCAFIIPDEILCKRNQISIYTYTFQLCSNHTRIQNEKKSTISLNSVNQLSADQSLEWVWLMTWVLCQQSSPPPIRPKMTSWDSPLFPFFSLLFNYFFPNIHLALLCWLSKIWDR